MLGHWFERGLGEIVAPSGGNGPEEEPLPPPMEHGVWQWVAPDPTFAAATPSHSSNSAERPSVAFQEDSDEHEHDGLVQCTHCRKWTPGQPHQDQHQHHSAGTPAKVGRTSTPFRTPQSASGSSSGQYWMDSAERVKALVTDAAVSTAQAKASTVGGLWEQRHKFFMLVSADPPLETDPKKEEKLRKFRKKILKLLKMDPSLARARCVDAQHHTIQEGYTPLHAAAAAGNCVAAQCLLDTCETPDELELILDERDFAGNTPLHIASEYGQLGMVQLLKSNSRTEPVGPNAPMDLLGRTPLGSALSSRKPNHRHNMGFIEKELFSPGDGSIMGKQTPAHERSGGLALSSRRRARSRLPTPSNNDDNDNEHVQDNNLLYGYSEMPGKRIIMEDAICAHYPLIPPKFANDDHELSSSKQRKHWVGFFGVFDGHGDGGAISKYVAEHVVNQVCGTNDWQSYVGGMDCLARALTKACTELDADMSKLSWSTNGGSTGIMAMISGDAIVVANVGDSRCILIQSPQTKHADAEEQTTMSQLTDSTTQLSLTSTEEQTDTKKESHKIVVVKALSEDHKPDLPVERMRIEEAGLTVVADTFLEEENETETTIYKIEKSHNNKIAVSRAFGDFDYKDQPDKPLDQQAIVATPEIQIHARDPNRDLFLVLACDGVWDVMTNQEVGDFCAKTHAELLSTPFTTTTPEQVLPEVGDRLLKECVEVRGTRDNVSVLIVNLQNTMNHPTTNLHAGTAVRALQFDD